MAGAADVHAQLEADAHAGQGLDVGPHDGFRQAVGRDAVGEHAAGLRHPLKHRQLVARPAQEVARRQPGRTGAHDRDVRNTMRSNLLLQGALGRAVELAGAFEHVVAQEAFDLAHRHRFVAGRAVALRLAGGRADPPGDGRHRVGAQQDLGGLARPAGADQAHVAGISVWLGQLETQAGPSTHMPPKMEW